MIVDKVIKTTNNDDDMIASKILIQQLKHS